MLRCVCLVSRVMSTMTTMSQIHKRLMGWVRVHYDRVIYTIMRDSIIYIVMRDSMICMGR